MSLTYTPPHGDDYVILQCGCGCDPMDIAAAMAKKPGVLAVIDPHVVMQNSKPVLRARIICAPGAARLSENRAARRTRRAGRSR
jgi:hypothetical protein